ncbi:hypothetical protein GQ44DRAFT_433592 [Phaeosphaeriaceae sp. PMI808]|nr:hypothetical protein GQ44DRAFT_433592 [Phaeosphaeriaceae sp. PMI808]
MPSRASFVQSLSLFHLFPFTYPSLTLFLFSLTTPLSHCVPHTTMPYRLLTGPIPPLFSCTSKPIPPTTTVRHTVTAVALHDRMAGREDAWPSSISRILALILG